MIRKYRIDFRWASGIQIHPYCTDGIIVEAHTAEDALTQAGIELAQIRSRNDIHLWSNEAWIITKIAPVPDGSEQAAIEAEREACADMAKAIKEKELRRLDVETCCSQTAAEIEECIRARSEGEKKEPKRLRTFDTRCMCGHVMSDHGYGDASGYGGCLKARCFCRQFQARSEDEKKS